MADILTNSWSEIASDNSAAPPDGWPEGMARSAVNNAARENMGAIKRLVNRLLPTRASVTGGQDAGGKATLYQVDYTVPPTAFVQGAAFAFRADKACAAAPKLKVNTLPAQPLLKATMSGIRPLAAGDIVAGQHVQGCYDALAGGVILLSLLAPAAGGAANVGDLKQSAADDGGPGWIACDGRALSRTTYAVLFAAIGTRYGAGDGATTFNLPDARERALIGAGVGLEASRLGEAAPVAPGWAGGEGRHALSLAELPAHAHTASTEAAGQHTHSGATSGVGDHTHAGYTDAQGQHAHNAWTDVQGQHQHAYKMAGSGGAPFLAGAVTYGNIDMLTTPDGAHGHSIGMDAQGNHAHNVQTYGGGAHSHSIAVDASGQHTHNVTVASAGQGQAHSSVQPSLAVNTFIFSGVL